MLTEGLIGGKPVITFEEKVKKQPRFNLKKRGENKS
mgnify:FL=1